MIKLMCTHTYIAHDFEKYREPRPGDKIINYSYFYKTVTCMQAILELYYWINNYTMS